MPFHDGDTVLWDDMFAVNFWGVAHGTRTALGALRRSGGVIINIASIAGLVTPRGHSAYAAAKTAVLALTRANAVECAEAGIRVNAIAAGPLDTEGFRAAGGDPKNVPARFQRAAWSRLRRLPARVCFARSCSRRWRARP